jgi:nucleoid-associated protein YejK
MSFENLVVEKVVLHEVFKRRHDGALIAARHAEQLVALPTDAMGSFTERVIDAMGDASQSMELEIAEYGPDSAVALAASLVGTPDGGFIAGSAKFADKLANAQQAKNLPGGIVVVFTGTVGATSRPFVAVIKAEKQSGFRERGTAIQYLTDLFLTPASKLYKIGFFTHADARRSSPEPWRAHVYDSHMTQRNREGAAKYFYGTFLGCRMPENSAFLTRSFFENTRAFIRQLAVEPEVKDDLLTSLYTYLKVDQTPTIQVNSFSTAYLPDEAQDNYTNYMRSKNFPLTAVQKDIGDLKGQLRKRRVRFSGSIELSGPPEAFRDLIEIETVVALGAAGESTEWTHITIKDRIQAQE